MISIDFEKCFDTIEKDAIIGSMRSFGISEQFIQWGMLLYEGFQQCTVKNGTTSDWFYPSRAIHQGCPISSYLFLLCAQILALQLTANVKIKGILIAVEVIHLLPQFADDTDIFTII